MLQNTGITLRLDYYKAANRDVCAIAQHYVGDLRVDMHTIDLPSDQPLFEKAHGFLSTAEREKNRVSPAAQRGTN